MKHLTIALLLIIFTLTACNGVDEKAKYPEEEIKDIPPIMLPSDFLKGNYIGLIQCKTLYEMQLFTAYTLIFDNKDNSKEFLESEEFKKTCDSTDNLTIRCGYIEKFKEKSNELVISQDLSRGDFWSEKDLAEFYAYKMFEFSVIANAEEEEELVRERIAKLQITNDLSTCMDYRDYVDGNLQVDIDVENKEELEELSKKDFNELSLNDQAMMYLLGRGVKQDFKEAVRLFSIMAEEGDEYAQANLGLTYADGKGVKKDYEKAIYWFKKSAEQGNASALTSLGRFYNEGLGVDKDPEEAMRLYRLSAEQGNWSAQRNLGYIYKEGEYIPIDLVKSFMWFLLAGSSGDREFIESELNELRNVLDESQERQAYEMAEKCISSEYLDCGYLNEIYWECPPSEYFKCVYSNNESNWDPLAFVCNYQGDYPITLQIENETLRYGSLDVKHQFKILKRNNSSIEWNDTSYMKVPFDVSHILDLENQELTFNLSSAFNLSSEGTKLDCIQVEENEIEDYEKDMTSVMVEEDWTPRLPPLSFYLKMAEDKDHSKVIHQMNLRCAAFHYLLAVNTLSHCDDLDIFSKESEVKQCLSDTTFAGWKEVKKNLEYHINEHTNLNNVGNYLSNAQMQMQSSLFMKAYNKSAKIFLNKEEDESCWGDQTGLLCWEEEKLMCEKLREEKSLQDWFESLQAD